MKSQTPGINLTFERWFDRIKNDAINIIDSNYDQYFQYVIQDYRTKRLNPLHNIPPWFNRQHVEMLFQKSSDDEIRILEAFHKSRIEGFKQEISESKTFREFYVSVEHLLYMPEEKFDSIADKIQLLYCYPSKIAHDLFIFLDNERDKAFPKFSVQLWDYNVSPFEHQAWFDFLEANENRMKNKISSV